MGTLRFLREHSLSALRSLGALYAVFRSGPFFMFALSVFCTSWLFFDWRTNFDPDYGLYNVILSTEASINGTFIVIVSEKFERRVTEILDWLRQTMTGIRVLMEAQAAEMEQVHELTAAVLDLLKAGGGHGDTR